MIWFATNILLLYPAKFPMVDHQLIPVDNNLSIFCFIGFQWVIKYESYCMSWANTLHSFSKTMSIYLFWLSILRRIHAMLLPWSPLLLLKRSFKIIQCQKSFSKAIWGHKPLLSHISLNAFIKSCVWHSIMKIIELWPRPVIGPRNVAKLGAFGWKVP